MPAGLGDLGGGALGGLDIPNFGAPDADAPTRQAEPSAPSLPPLGF